MEPTRRALAVAGLAALLAALAAVLARPRLLVGTAGLGGWLLARQHRFRRTLSRVDRHLTVVQSPARESVAAGDEATVRVAASLDEPVPATVSVAAAPPVAATGTTAADRAVTVAPGETGAAADVPLRWPVAGTFSFGRPHVSVTSGGELFCARVRRGPAPTVTVAPRARPDRHVGRGNDPAALGDHPAGRTGAGVAAAEVREYAPGEPATRIDWAATARLGRPHVREFEATSAAGAWLVVDARRAMAAGPAGRTMADRAREVALAEVAAHRRSGEPVGLTVVGPDGPAVERRPASGTAHYRTLRTLLCDVGGPAAGGTTGSEAGGPGVGRPPPGGRVAGRPPLAGGTVGLRPGRLPRGTGMADALAPFVDGATGSAGDGLAAAATRVARSGVQRAVVVTADADRTGVEAAVRRAHEGGARVDVHVAPSVLYAARGPADLESVAAGYRTFETFRRRLDGLDGVTAHEVAPCDRPAAGSAGRRTPR